MTVSAMRSRLTDEDVRNLVRSQSPRDRALATRKICLRIDAGALDAADRAAAEDVVRVIAQDAAALVRRALAVTLQNSQHLPHDVAMRLARDIDEVATPVLTHSPVLTDRDLIDILHSDAGEKHMAIAGRAELSSRVVRSIVSLCDERVVARTAANDGADFDETGYDRALDRFGECPSVTDAFISRSAIPSTVTEKLVALISDEALERLSKRHALPPQLAVELAEGARERATIDILDQAGCATDMTRFVQQLALNGRLTPSLVLRGLCLGHMRFFEHALAELAGIAHNKVWLLVHDAGPLGLRAVFERARLPQRVFNAVRIAVDVYHEIELGSGEGDRARFAHTMLQRVLTQDVGMSRDEIDYLLDKLDAVAGDRSTPATPAAHQAGAA